MKALNSLHNEQDDLTIGWSHRFTLGVALWTVCDQQSLWSICHCWLKVKIESWKSVEMVSDTDVNIYLFAGKWLSSCLWHCHQLNIQVRANSLLSSLGDINVKISQIMNNELKLIKIVINTLVQTYIMNYSLDNDI